MDKSFFFLVAGLGIGAAVGLWQPHGELLAMRLRLHENDKEVASLRRQAGAASIASMFHPSPQGKAPIATGELPPPANEPPHDGVTIEMHRDDPAAANAEKGPLEQESVQAMTEALDARAAEARAALVEQADLSDEELAAFDAAVDRMNERLQKPIEALAAQLTEGEEPSRRDLMELGAEGLDAMIEADEAITAAIPAEVRESVDEELLDPFSHVDGSTLTSLAQFEGVETK